MAESDRMGKGEHDDADLVERRCVVFVNGYGYRVAESAAL
jgi:hypothetical protein